MICSWTASICLWDSRILLIYILNFLIYILLGQRLTFKDTFTGVADYLFHTPTERLPKLGVWGAASDDFLLRLFRNDVLVDHLVRIRVGQGTRGILFGNKRVDDFLLLPRCNSLCNCSSLRIFAMEGRPSSAWRLQNFGSPRQFTNLIPWSYGLRS